MSKAIYIGIITKRSGQKFVHKMDYRDYKRLTKKLHINSTGYIALSDSQYLHRVILKAPKDSTVDHINHDTLDNRRINLRLCTKSQNGMNRKSLSRANTSGCPGVWFHNSSKLWNAVIRVNRKRTFLGCFKEKEKAIQAYKQAARIKFGEFFHELS